MKKNLENFPNQCKEALALGKGIKIDNINKIVISGIGGSAFAGDVLKAIVNEEIEITVNRDYYLPKSIDSQTLVFSVSYSGNTEETLYSAEEALAKGCKIIGISSDGELEKFCITNNLPYVRVPSGVEPRNALGYLSLPLIRILEENNIINRIKLENIPKDLKNNQIKRKAKQIANLLFKTIPLIYSSERFKCLSYGWKTRLNENTKIHAFANQIPELDHNELVGYTKKIGNFFTLIIRDKDDLIRNKKRFDITKKLIEKYKSKCLIVDTIGTNLASRVFCTLYLADWVSYCLALKYGIDPGPVKIIEYLKSELNK